MDKQSICVGILFGVGYGLGFLLGTGHGKSTYKGHIKNSKILFVNKDTLSDLVLGNGEIYLQKKEGGFISYESFIEQQKTALKDSIENKIKNLSNERNNLDLQYNAKIDSIKQIYSK